MATKRKTTKKIGALAPIAETPVTVLEALAKNATRLALSPAWKARIAAVLEQSKIPVPPLWLNGGRVPQRQESGSYSCYDFGGVHGFTVQLFHTKETPNRTYLRWGCRKKYTEADARLHWRDGYSKISMERRDRAKELLDFLSALCKQQGWKW